MKPLFPRPRRAQKQFVCVGASNLFMCLPDLLDQILARFETHPVSVLVVQGPGRSFGLKAGMLGARFVPINDCGLLEALDAAQSPGHPESWALLTDIGNDVLYGVAVAQIHGWLDDFVSRLVRMGVRVGVTALATERLMAVSRWRYELVHRAMHPQRRLGYKEARLALNELDRHFPYQPLRDLLRVSEW